jgi:hypothetical protein
MVKIQVKILEFEKLLYSLWLFSEHGCVGIITLHILFHEFFMADG